jgi:hypothetical protein
MNDKMKYILNRMMEGNNEFSCNWNGQERKCSIEKIDFIISEAYVKFDVPVKKRDTQWEYVPFSYDNDEVLVEIEVDSSHEWISIRG